MSKKVIVFGATGLMGKQIVKENLKSGNKVSVYIRQNEYPENVTIITGELNDENKIAEAIKGFDVIVSAVGNRNYEDPTMVVAPVGKLLAKLVLDNQRLIIVGGSGLTLHDSKTLRRDLAGQPEFLKNQRADHWEAYTNIALLDINYLFICPTMVVEGDADGNYLSQENYFPKSEAKQISAGNVGHFIAKEIVENKFNKTRIGLVNS
ncbi:NAD(P)-dependent oxidoreductase [Chryseobacterium sp. G0201]|uniref:NAD(P)-dependent oxidoreductase n=1 Tax=Chryseobacterium sp. G0201 TaxID=2487065 RepID=UPI000F512EE9|nr:NAD(P)H-binding protein [Chryseobacterium sp. G0201]AZA54586.1 NAD-dependent epimerase/dehydratase family protein [Chryseobacterium sp. G0201]